MKMRKKSVVFIVTAILLVIATILPASASSHFCYQSDSTTVSSLKVLASLQASAYTSTQGFSRAYATNRFDSVPGMSPAHTQLEMTAQILGTKLPKNPYKRGYVNICNYIATDECSIPEANAAYYLTGSYTASVPNSNIIFNIPDTRVEWGKPGTCHTA